MAWSVVLIAVAKIAAIPRRVLMSFRRQKRRS